jgi:4-hydroxybenzoate polyprenyltransferase
LIALLLILAAVHAGNAWRDREGDRANRKGYPVGMGLVGIRSLFVLGGGAVVGAALLSLGVSGFERCLLIASLLLGISYTAPPLELKRRPCFDLLAQGLGYGFCAFLLGAAGTGVIGPSGSAGASAHAFAAALPYALGIVTVSLVTMLADRAGDERVGQRTSVVALGPRRAAAVASALAWATMTVGLWNGELTPALWGATAGTILSLTPDPNLISPGSWNARSIWLQLLFLGILAPISPAPICFALLMGAVTDRYNRWRWGVGYPLQALRRGGI